MPMCASSSRSRMNTCRSFAVPSARYVVDRPLIKPFSFRNQYVWCLPDEMLAAVHGDHLTGDRRSGQEIAHRIADVLRFGAAPEDRCFALAAEMHFALARVDDRGARCHRVDADARRERLRERGV